MKTVGIAVALMVGFAAAAPAAAEIALFSQRNFQGARYSLEKDSANMSFSPRSARVAAGDTWEICPRPFFGGTCVKLAGNKPGLSLPRAFSGVVRSARRIGSKPPPAEVVAPPPAPRPEAVKPAPEPPRPEPKAETRPEPKKPEPKPELNKADAHPPK